MMLMSIGYELCIAAVCQVKIICGCLLCALALGANCWLIADSAEVIACALRGTGS